MVGPMATNCFIKKNKDVKRATKPKVTFSNNGNSDTRYGTVISLPLWHVKSFKEASSNNNARFIDTNNNDNKDKLLNTYN